MKIKLFLDDVRIPKDCIHYMHHRIGELNPIYLEDDWQIVRDYDEFRKFIDENKGNIEYISFDRDLADEHLLLDEMYLEDHSIYNKNYEKFKEKTGLDCARYLKVVYSNNNLELPTYIFVHSMNPVGTMNIINEFKK